MSELPRLEVPRALLLRSTLPGLIRDALFDWLGIALCWAAMYWGPAWLYPAWILLIAGRLHALGVLAHDAAHLPLKGNPVKALLFEILAAYPIASTLKALRYHHLRHHRDNGMRWASCCISCHCCTACFQASVRW